MSSPIDTEEWGLSAFMDWKPTKKTVECESCDGKGVVGGGFKDMEGPRECSNCGGRGWHSFYPKTKQPEIPNELIEHMRAAWIAYWESNGFTAAITEQKEGGGK